MNGANIKSLSITDNPICQLSASILRNYVIAIMSSPPSNSTSSSNSLATFNELEVTPTERNKANQLFRNLLLIANRRLKSQQLSIDQSILTLCTPTIDPSNTSSAMSLQSSSSNALLPSQSNDALPELFRNSSRSGSLCLIDPLASPLTPKPPILPNALPPKVNSNGPVEGVRRLDLEYRYPYKSFIPPGEKGITLNIGNNTLLTSPNLVPDIIQVVLNRRKMEAKFHEVRPDRILFSFLINSQVLDNYIDTIILEAVEYNNLHPLQKKGNMLRSRIGSSSSHPKSSSKR